MPEFTFVAAQPDPRPDNDADVNRDCPANPPAAGFGAAAIITGCVSSSKMDMQVTVSVR